MRRGRIKKHHREKDQRKALHKALATALIDHEKIKTTQVKAKSLSISIEKMITLAKKGDLASRKLLLNQLGIKAVTKLCNDIAPRFKDRKGGYTVVTKLGRRLNDGAPISIIELTKAMLGSGSGQEINTKA